MATKTNDQIILEQIVKERCSESGDEMSITEYFELYTASELLKDFDLSYDDIKYGIVGNGGDGGIDSLFIFLNGELVKEDTPINFNQRKNEIELILIQSKTSFNLKEDAVVKFRETAEDLFNLANNPNDFSKRYNQELIDKAKLFRSIYTGLAKNFPKLTIKYYYATQGDEIHNNVKGKVEKLQESVNQMFNGSNFNFQFIGAKQLLEITRSVPSTSRALEVSESPITTLSGSYI
jgi:hypothetical protein